MAGLVNRIMRLFSPEMSERGAEDDVIERAPESVRERLRAIVQRRRQTERTRRMVAGGPAQSRRQAAQEAEEG